MILAKFSIYMNQRPLYTILELNVALAFQELFGISIVDNFIFLL